MNKKYAIIGGDLRLLNLSTMLTKDENIVYLYGQEKYKKIYNSPYLIKCNSLKDSLKNAEIIVSSIPFSKNGIDIYSPFSDNKINFKEIIKYLNGKIFIAGSIPKQFYDMLNNKEIQVIDLMNKEELVILNTIATAEGAISDIILNTSSNIHGSKILILGFGRVAKELAIKLKNLEAKITCAARKSKDFAWMEALGIQSTNINHLNENIREYDVIINTVPQLILNEDKIKYINKESLIIDLASKPGGVDKEACEKIGLKFIWSLAIPGKVAPFSSAGYIKNTIYNILNKEKE